MKKKRIRNIFKKALNENIVEIKLKETHFRQNQDLFFKHEESKINRLNF